MVPLARCLEMALLTTRGLERDRRDGSGWLRTAAPMCPISSTVAARRDVGSRRWSPGRHRPDQGTRSGSTHPDDPARTDPYSPTHTHRWQSEQTAELLGDMVSCEDNPSIPGGSAALPAPHTACHNCHTS